MDQKPIPRVFLSYATKDRKLVRELYKTLAQEETITPWFDEKILLPGVEWEREIGQAVWETDIILVCFSPRALTSKGELDEEIRYALAVGAKRGEARPPIVVLKLEAGNLPAALEGYPVVERYDKRWPERLLEVIHAQRLPERPPALPALSAKSAAPRVEGGGPQEGAPAAGGGGEVARGTPAWLMPRAGSAARERTAGGTSGAKVPGPIPMNVPRGRSTASAAQASPTMWLRSTLGIGMALVIIAVVVVVWKKGTETLADESMQQPLAVTAGPTPSPATPVAAAEEAFDQIIPMPMRSTISPLTTTMSLAVTSTVGAVLQPIPTNAVEPTSTPTPTDTPAPTSTPTPTNTVEPTRPPSPAKYIVRPGDTLQGIAADHGLTIEEILVLNAMRPSEADLIYPGQELIVSR